MDYCPFCWLPRFNFYLLTASDTLTLMCVHSFPWPDTSSDKVPALYSAACKSPLSAMLHGLLISACCCDHGVLLMTGDMQRVRMKMGMKRMRPTAMMRMEVETATHTLKFDT